MLSVIVPLIGAILIAYLIGAISFSYLAGKLLKGIDLRQHGSGNLGASNVFRTLGRWPGIIVLLLDILKGYVAVNIAYRLGGGSLASDDTLALLGVLAGLAAILGHIFTLYHGFKGGKGIATSLGVFIYLAPTSITVSFGVWLIVFLSTRYISLGSIAAAIALPLCMLAQRHIFLQDIPGILLGLSTLVSVVVILKHTSNIQRLLAGKENRFEWK
jgi:glycerol-3-phosphate acyltransferase PlsY